ncbi:DNA-directed DNA polymerase II small subunit [Candidatus Woesearchaeota archaeon]|nr:MAG: DNA polymerase II small subunit [archaeon GW2011_AR4]MBS3129134.1 DNA-directed DNA polymerase II small subunit [Candidatus Woesearchaeota archaeon]HIH37866.1 DNA-directed DNA polymerase II small subunit [Candidatus Woesearchaeota archaeon]
MSVERKQAVVEYFLARGMLVTPEVLEAAGTMDPEELYLLHQKEEDHTDKKEECITGDGRQLAKDPSVPPASVNIIFSYDEKPQKKSIKDFTDYFRNRFQVISGLLRNRQELANLMSVARVKEKRDKERVSLIGLITKKETTKNGNLVIGIEDTTGEMTCVIHKNKPDILERSKDLVLDEVVGVVGTSSDGIVFLENVVFPDIPVNRELKKCPDEVYAVFLSDIHVGSSYFLEEDFHRFLSWINGDFGTEEHRALAAKVRYLFIVGDLVDGVGIYPGQESELKIKDIYEQYKRFFEFVKLIPDSISIIISTGNHDAVRLSEPQPPLPKEFIGSFSKPNTYFVSNPSRVLIHHTDIFPGLDVLLYHGYSMDYYAQNLESVRIEGGYKRPDLLMRHFLQKRHLAPSHTSTLYVPGGKDYLVIESAPDIFVTGHIHKSGIANYRNTTMICGSCFQDTTPFQIKVGHSPEPGRVPIINLQTRQAKILKFIK